ncbi:TolC family protein [Rhodanobacter thiooxydans]|uniref:TolC family protein n=1 Tax=Rhodanobacter thiooxydans TaxID=416169 RepID=UPI000D3BEB0B|nr:TolC family protein [Rhodanobacter thiooxydans]
MTWAVAKTFLCVATLALCGCATYQSHPIDPAALRAHWQTHRLDDPSLAATVKPFLPPRDAGQWPPAAYGRAELFAVALALNPDLAESRAQMAQSVAAVTTAHALPNPKVGLALERFTQAQAGSAPWLWGVSTDWLIDGTLRRKLREDAANAGVRAARLDYAEKVWAVWRDIRIALADQMLGQRQESVATQTVDAAMQLEQSFAQRYQLGESSPGERLQAARTLAQAQRDEAVAAQRVVDAQARLARTIGVQASALKDVPLEWDGLDQPVAPPPAQLKQWADQALLSRADLERALVEYDTRETELHQQIRAQYPQVSLGPGYTYDHGMRKLTFGFNTSLPIFDRNQGPIAEAKARREMAGKHVEVVQADIGKEIDQSSAQLEVALHGLHAATQEHQLASRAADQATQAKVLGAEDRIAVLNARLAALAAAQTELVTLAQAQQALGALEDALRTPLDGAEVTSFQAIPGSHP